MPESRGRKPKIRTRRQLNRSPPRQTPLQRTAPPHRRWWQSTKWAIGTVVAILGLIASVYQLTGGPPWPTKPEIHPHDTVNASSLVLPFDVRNRSTLFGMTAEFNCGVNLLYFTDAGGHTGLLRDAMFNVGSLSISRGAMANLPCDAATFVKIRPDGSLMLGYPGGQHMTTAPGGFRPPLTILKMCLWINGNYRLFGFRLPFTSLMFQWPAEPNQKQWIEGPIAFDTDQEKWIPHGSELIGAWGLRQLTAKSADGKAELVPNALRCDSELL